MTRVRAIRSGEIPSESGINLYSLYAAGQELGKSLKSPKRNVRGEIIFLKGDPVSKRVSGKLTLDLLNTLRAIKAIVATKVKVQFLELSMFDPTDPSLDAFFFALLADDDTLIDRYIEEMKKNVRSELASNGEDRHRGVLVPNPALYLQPVIGAQHKPGFPYEIRNRECVYLGIFPGKFSRYRFPKAKSPKEMEIRARNFLNEVLRSMETKNAHNANSIVDTALLITFPRPAGNGPLPDERLKLRGGSLFVYGQSTMKNTETLTHFGLMVAASLNRAVMAISQSRAEFNATMVRMFQWFFHDAPKALDTLQNFYINRIEDWIKEPAELARIPMYVTQARRIITLALANFHAYGNLARRESKPKWETAKEKESVLELIQTVVAVNRSAAEDVDFSLTPSTGDIPWQIDSRKYMVLVDNLVTNAIRALERKQEDQQLTFAKRIRILVRKTKAGLQTTVVDNGCGMSVQERRRLLSDEPFSAFGSTGQGKVIFKALLEAGCGKWTVSSRLGIGTTCVFVLPELKGCE